MKNKPPPKMIKGGFTENYRKLFIKLFWIIAKGLYGQGEG